MLRKSPGDPPFLISDGRGLQSRLDVSAKNILEAPTKLDDVGAFAGQLTIALVANDKTVVGIIESEAVSQAFDTVDQLLPFIGRRGWESRNWRTQILRSERAKRQNRGALQGKKPEPPNGVAVYDHISDGGATKRHQDKPDREPEPPARRRALAKSNDRSGCHVRH